LHAVNTKPKSEMEVIFTDRSFNFWGGGSNVIGKTDFLQTNSKILNKIYAADVKGQTFV
jgi:hypothetical protein